jgi:tetratricopeptide (TPR) repeat protein
VDTDLHKDALISLAIFALTFSIYAGGASRTIYVGDSGELVTAVGILGIPHPSGYPLYVLLGKLWTLLVPVGSLAFRMSLFSAACAALACSLLYRLSRSLDVDRLSSLFAALLLAFAPSFWSQANIQRVYALGAVFVVAATMSAFRWRKYRNPGSLYLTFFLCGLGASNHTFMGLYAIVLAAFVALSDPSTLKSPGRIAGCAAATVAGLLPYAYLPIRSRFDPPLDWGNPETFAGFKDVVLRRDFWQRAWIETPIDLLAIGADYLTSVGTELLWAGAALSLIGIVVARRRGWPVALPVLIIAANFAALALHGSRSDIFIWHRYYIPSYVMAALLAGWGCHALVERMPRRTGLVMLAIPAALLATGWRHYDRSNYRIAESFSLAVLDSLPPGAHLIATDDNVLFVLMYLHLAEGRRPDVNLILQGVGGADLPPLRFTPDSERLFFTHHPNWNTPGLEIVPMGVVIEARRSGEPWPPLQLPIAALDGEHDPAVPKDYLTQNLIGLFHYTMGFSYEQRDWLEARRQFEAAARAAPDNDVLFYNLGLVFARNGLYADAVAAFERSHAINPRHLASVQKPRAIDRIHEMLAETERIEAIEATLIGDPAMAGLVAGTVAYELQLASALDTAGEPTSARGHRLRALEIGRVP